MTFRPFPSQVWPLFAYLGAVLLLSGLPLQAKPALRVASYNIRLKILSDALAGNGWEQRESLVKALISFHQFDLFGLQEVTAPQLQDLRSLQEFAHVGVGRENGKEAGEFAPIFFRLARFNPIDSGTFWLSDTPEQVSMGWDASYHRICTWIRLEDRLTGKVFAVFNTHFDNQGEKARQQSARLILNRLKPLMKEGIPVLLIGDFNATPTSEPYCLLNGTLADARQRSESPPYGPFATFNGFHYQGPFTDCIDHVFCDPGIRVLRFATLTDSLNQHFPSDHFPVLADIELP